MSLLYSRLQGTIQYNNPGTTDSYGTVNANSFGQYAFSSDYGAGTGPEQIAKAYHDHQIIASPGKITYVLSALANAIGITVVRRLFFHVLSPIGTTLIATIGPGTTNGWTAIGTEIVTPQSTKICDWPDVGAPPVTAGSNEQIDVTVSMGGMEYLIEIEGF